MSHSPVDSLPIPLISSPTSDSPSTKGRSSHVVYAIANRSIKSVDDRFPVLARMWKLT